MKFNEVTLGDIVRLNVEKCSDVTSIEENRHGSFVVKGFDEGEVIIRNLSFKDDIIITPAYYLVPVDVQVATGGNDEQP